MKYSNKAQKIAEIKRVSPTSGGTQCPLPRWMDLRVVYLSSQAVRLRKTVNDGKNIEQLTRLERVPVQIGSLFKLAGLVFKHCMCKYWNVWVDAGM